MAVAERRDRFLDHECKKTVAVTKQLVSDSKTDATAKTNITTA